ncbi:MAG: excinuclease ABC subunit C, partial [uncultured bacterium]
RLSPIRRLRLRTATDDFMYYVYILKSSKSGILYYGYSLDLRKRLKEHNDGRSEFTRPHTPWQLVWYCAFPREKQAKDFELYLKSGSGKAFAKKRLVK